MWTNAPSEHISVKFDSKCSSFHWRKQEFRNFVNKILVIVSQKGNYLGFCSCSSPNIPVDMSVKVSNTKVAATGCQNNEADEAPDDHDGVKGTAKVKYSIQWHWVMATHDDVIKWKHFPRYHLCGEFTGLRWIPRTKASDAELWYFFLSVCKYTVEKTIVRLVIWDAIVPIMTSL